MFIISWECLTEQIHQVRIGLCLLKDQNRGTMSILQYGGAIPSQKRCGGRQVSNNGVAHDRHVAFVAYERR